METVTVWQVKCVLKEHASQAVALIQTAKQMKYVYTTSAGNFNENYKLVFNYITY